MEDVEWKSAELAELILHQYYLYFTQLIVHVIVLIIT